MYVSKKIAKKLEVGLNVARVSMVIEGMGINHAHIKLYPLHGLSNKFVEMWPIEKIYFDKYEGYISTLTGEKVEMTKLKQIAEEIEQNQDKLNIETL